MHGFLFVQAVTEFDRERRHIEYDEPEASLSFLARGWYPIARSIKEGPFIKLSAERHGVSIEARFDIVNNVPRGDNGLYEIKGGPFAGHGVFRNISKREHADFKDYFVCHGVSARSGQYLRWQVGVNSFVDADEIADESET